MKRVFTTRWMLSLLAICTLLTFSACTKYSFMSVPDKIVGVWQFEEVKYFRGLVDFRSDDVTADYDDWAYEFRADGVFEMRNIYTNDLHRGYWDIVTVVVDNGSYYDADGVYHDMSSTEHELRFSVYDNINRRWEDYFWMVSSVTGKRLRATESYGRERWEYKMLRVE